MRIEARRALLAKLQASTVDVVYRVGSKVATYWLVTGAERERLQTRRWGHGRCAIIRPDTGNAKIDDLIADEYRRLSLLLEQHPAHLRLMATARERELRQSLQTLRRRILRDFEAMIGVLPREEVIAAVEAGELWDLVTIGSVLES